MLLSSSLEKAISRVGRVDRTQPQGRPFPLSSRRSGRLQRARAQRQDPSEAVLDLDAPSTSASRASVHEVYQVADAGAYPQAASSSGNPLAELAATNPAGLATAAAALGLTIFGLLKVFNKGSRTYNNNVGQE